jgi:hypothetical protein
VVEKEVFTGLKVIMTKINDDDVEYEVWAGAQRNLFNKYPQLRIPTMEKIKQSTAAIVAAHLEKKK